MCFKNCQKKLKTDLSFTFVLLLVSMFCFCVFRNQQKAEKHSRLALLRKYFIAWQVWVQSEQERRHLEKAQEQTRNKMASLLEAAASGKLWSQSDAESQVSTARSQTSGNTQRRSERQSTADKIVCALR